MDYCGYTKLDNAILFNLEISAQAKILYMQFLYYSTIPNFVIRKATMIKTSGLKGNTFEKYLKELKSHKLVEVHAVRVGRKYEYHYTVADKSRSGEKGSICLSHSKVKTVEERVLEDTGCTAEEARQAIVIANCNAEVKNKVGYAIGVIENKRQQRSNNRSKELISNRFNNFSQRQYSDEDIAKIERMLLQKNYLVEYREKRLLME